MEWEEVRTNAVRQLQHNDCSGLVFAYDMEIINAFVDGQEKEIARLQDSIDGTISLALEAYRSRFGLLVDADKYDANIKHQALEEAAKVADKNLDSMTAIQIRALKEEP